MLAKRCCYRLLRCCSLSTLLVSSVVGAMPAGDPSHAEVARRTETLPRYVTIRALKRALGPRIISFHEDRFFFHPTNGKIPATPVKQGRLTIDRRVALDPAACYCWAKCSDAPEVREQWRSLASEFSQLSRSSRKKAAIAAWGRLEISWQKLASAERQPWIDRLIAEESPPPVASGKGVRPRKARHLPKQRASGDAAKNSSRVSVDAAHKPPSPSDGHDGAVAVLDLDEVEVPLDTGDEQIMELLAGERALARELGRFRTLLAHRQEANELMEALGDLHPLSWPELDELIQGGSVE